MEVKEKNDRKVSEKSKAVIEDEARVLDSAASAVYAFVRDLSPVLCVEGNSPFPEDIRDFYQDEEELIQAKEGKRNERVRREGAESNTD